MRKIIGSLLVLLLFLLVAPAEIHTQAEPELSTLDVVQVDVDQGLDVLTIDAIEFTRYDAGDRPQLTGSRFEASSADVFSAPAVKPPMCRSRAYHLRL